MPFNVNAIKNVRGEDETALGYDPDGPAEDKQNTEDKDTPEIETEAKNTEDEPKPPTADTEPQTEDVDDLFSEGTTNGSKTESKESEDVDDLFPEDQSTTDSEPSQDPVVNAESEDDELPSLNKPEPDITDTITESDTAPEETEVNTNPTPDAQREMSEEASTEEKIHDESGLPMKRYVEIKEEIERRKVDNSEHTTTQLRLNVLAKIFIPFSIIFTIGMAYLILSYLGALSAIVTTVPTIIMFIIGAYILLQDFTPS